MSKYNKHKIGKHEVRVIAQPAGQRFTVRSNPDENTRIVSGYFATFGTMSHNLGFREVLEKGCFADSLKVQPVVALRDHSWTMPLGKTQSGTLSVTEDDKGLAFRLQLPDVSYSNDLVALMKRGDATECSYSFTVAPEDEEWSQLPNGEILRTIKKCTVYEGSILTGAQAAYPHTSANLRSCPSDIRAKLMRSSGDALDDDNYRPECDDESELFDPDADCGDHDDDDEDRDICSACGQPILREDQEAERAAHLDLIIRKLRS